MRMIALVATGAEVAAHVGDTLHVPDQPALRALLPLSGMTVVERQARDLAAAGASIVLIEASQPTANLSAAVERIRTAGIACSIVGNPRDIVAELTAGDMLLLMADGLHIAPDKIAAMAAVVAPTILTCPDDGLTASFERLDATTRWAGLAAVPATAVDPLAALPGEWDMVLTLLRTAVQAGARRMACGLDQVASGQIAVVSDASVGALVDQRSIDALCLSDGGMVGDRLVRPFARWAAPKLLRAPASTRWLGPMSLATLGAVVPTAYFAGLGVAGIVGLTAMLLVAQQEIIDAFRRDGSATPRLTMAKRAASIGMLPLAVAAGSVGAGQPVLEAALSALPTLAFVWSVLTARTLASRGRDNASRDPDADAGWMTLATTGGFADSSLMPAILAVIGPVMLWWAVQQHSTDTRRAPSD